MFEETNYWAFKNTSFELRVGHTMVFPERAVKLYKCTVRNHVTHTSKDFHGNSELEVLQPALNELFKDVSIKSLKTILNHCEAECWL